MNERPLYQRGANGRIAERQCAAVLVDELHRRGLPCRTDPVLLRGARDAAVAQFSGDLSTAQIDRALAQGQALGRYIADSLLTDPERLGLTTRGIDPRADAVSVLPVGNLTNSGSSADLVLAFTDGDAADVHVPISLKAYRGETSSLGSKGARASLTRLFASSAQLSDDDFVDRFGTPGREFLALLVDFKQVAKEFYSSAPEGVVFMDHYEQRKGTRKVSNPLRRKELGDYFASRRGFRSEHRFAESYVAMFEQGCADLGSPTERDRFYEGMRFLLGMEGDVITLNAVADDGGTVVRIVNSLTASGYGLVNHLLEVHAEVTLTARPNSGNIGVRLRRADVVSDHLQLAMWKDATIQFKISGGGTS